MSSIALVDCNNFFVSCERVFNPKLIGRPVAVLSCNDGCIISRSAEVKAWGVPMGAPYFQWADLLEARSAFVCSSNFALYADLSNRVMQTLAACAPDLEIYSIDEAFLLLQGIKDPLNHCRTIRKTVLQWTGIPVSIGIAPTKTLAKLASRTAKKNEALEGVYFPSGEETAVLLQQLAVADIWGIGERLAERLAKWGIFTAAALSAQSDLWVRRNLSVTGLRTVLELRGIPCLPVEEGRACKQSIMTSRSFGRPVLAEQELLEALCSYAARGAEKLREEGRLASWIQLFIMTRPYSEEPYYSNWSRIILQEPSDFTPTLLQAVSNGLKEIFRPGLAYKKAGILLGGLVPKEAYQQDLLAARNLEQETKKQAAMKLIDRANRKFGYRAIHFASEGVERSWQMKRAHISPSFTTSWPDLLRIQI